MLSNLHFDKSALSDYVLLRRLLKPHTVAVQRHPRVILCWACRRMEDRRLHRIGGVVADELHLLGDPRRGYLLEVLLTKLLYMNRLADRSADR